MIFQREIECKVGEAVTTIVDRTKGASRAEDTGLEGFFEEHVDAVYAYALRRVKEPSAAEDIAAETFSEVFRRPHRVPKSDPRPWLFGVARRKIVDHRRRTKGRREVALAPDLSTSDQPAFVKLIDDEESIRLRNLIDDLPSLQREALLLHYVEGLSAKQIAASLHRSTFAVNSLLQRARKRISERGRDYFMNDGSN